MRAVKKAKKKPNNVEFPDISMEELTEIVTRVLERRTRRAQKTHFIDHLADIFSFSTFLQKEEKDPDDEYPDDEYYGFLEDRIMLSRDFVIVENRLSNEENRNG